MLSSLAMLASETGLALKAVVFAVAITGLNTSIISDPTRHLET